MTEYLVRLTRTNNHQEDSGPFRDRRAAEQAAVAALGNQAIISAWIYTRDVDEEESA